MNIDLKEVLYLLGFKEYRIYELELENERLKEAIKVMQDELKKSNG